MALYAKCVQDLLLRASEAHVVYASRNKPTLKPMIAMCDRMRNPQNHYKTIHIGGTNGKGSVSTKIAASLSFCGYRVGLFTSPHISSIRERICINGRMISKMDFVADFNKIISYENDIDYKLSYFEILSALAFYHFKRVGVDFAIIEVGVGGTWDSTNIIKEPLLSIIVSISLDHTKLLGNTVEQIATDKCGIIKTERPCIIGPTVPYKIAKLKCNETNSDLYQLKKDNIDSYDEHNSNLVKYSLEILNNKYYILPKSIDKFKKTLQVRPHCRMENININLYKLFKILSHHSSNLISSNNKKWLKKYISTEINYQSYKNNQTLIQCIFDVAHNPEAFKQLFKSIQNKYSPLQYSYRIILGINPHKKITNCCKIITQYADYIHLVSSKNEYYSLDINKLKKVLIENCKYDENKISTKGNGDIFTEIIYGLNQSFLHNNFNKKELNSINLYSSQSDDVSSSNSAEKVIENKYKTEILIITGSFYIMSDARKSLGLKYDDDQYDIMQYKQHLRKDSE